LYYWKEERGAREIAREMYHPNVTSDGTTKRKNSPVKLEDIYNQNIEIQNQNVQLGHQNVKIINEISSVRTDLTSIDKRVHDIEKNVEKYDEKFGQFDLRLNALDQYNLRNCMEIKGVHQDSVKSCSDLKKFVFELFKELKVSCVENRVEKVYSRVFPAAKKPLCIIFVWFFSDEDKIKLMREKYLYESKNKIKNGIFFNHSLTPYNRSLFNKAYSVKSQLAFSSVIVKNGKIALKKNKDSKPVYLLTFDDLDQLLTRQTEPADIQQQQHHPPTANAPSYALAPSKIPPTNQLAHGMSSIPPTQVSPLDFSIFQLNVRGLNDLNKFSILKTSITSLASQPDIIVLTEVKLKPNFPIGIYSLDGYMQYTALRDAQHSKGGVLVYVKNQVEHVYLGSTSDLFDKVTIQVISSKGPISIFCYYRPPSSVNFSNFMKDVEAELNIDHKQKLLVGDLNIDWLGDCNESKKFRDLLTCFGYETTNSIRTRPISDKIIDHVVSNFHEKIPISNFTIDQDKWFSDHSAILSVVHCSVGSKSLKGFVSINDVNFETLEENFCFIPPEKSNDANEIANALMDASKIAVGYSTHTHTFKVKNPDKISPHFNFELFTALKEKDHWKEKHDKNPRSIEAADKYKQACSKFKELDAKLYNQYLESKFNNVEPKSAWKNINELLGRRKNDDDEIKEIIIDHRSVTDPSEIANELNRCFTSDQFECAQSRLPNIEFHESSIRETLREEIFHVYAFFSELLLCRNFCFIFIKCSLKFFKK
jgi:hypothetical protein